VFTSLARKGNIDALPECDRDVLGRVVVVNVAAHCHSSNQGHSNGSAVTKGTQTGPHSRHTLQSQHSRYLNTRHSTWNIFRLLAFLDLVRVQS
jgi:hypothetical protein